MIHSKKLKFTYSNTEFEAVVSYSDEKFGNSLHKKDSIFWSVKLNKPKVLECGGEVFNANGVMGKMMLLKSELKELRYIYKENKNYQRKNKINIYPKTIERVIYMYFNQKIIEKYIQKTELFKKAIDLKYREKLKKLNTQRRELKKQLKSKVIDNKEYQKRYKPIRANKEDLIYKISSLKERYFKRYFECNQLKKVYRKVL